MKKYFLIILISIPFTLFCQENQNIPDVLTVIHNRKSVRVFTEEKVSKEQLTTLVRAGMSAPTAMNKQPWAFFAIDSLAIKDALSEALSDNQIIKNASALIVVCGDLNKSVISVKDYWIQDCSASTQNILLATEGIGLGAVWIGIHPRLERIEAVRNVLNLPLHLIPLNVIAIGYPTGEEKPKDKWLPENIYWNTYQY